MEALNHLSRKAVVGLWLFVTLVPFCWIFFVPDKSWQWFWLAPFWHGLVVMFWGHNVTHSSAPILLLSSGLISVALAGVTLS